MLLQTGFRRGAPDSQLAEARTPQRGKNGICVPLQARKRTWCSSTLAGVVGRFLGRAGRRGGFWRGSQARKHAKHLCLAGKCCPLWRGHPVPLCDVRESFNSLGKVSRLRV